LARPALTAALAVREVRALPVTVTPERFDAWYAELRAPLRAYLRGMTKSAAAADDLFQETWIRLLGHPPTTLESGAVRAYVFTIATRLAIDAGRHEAWIGRFLRPARARTQDDEPAADPVESTVDPARGADARYESHEAVAAALGALTPRERALIWLAHVERYDHDEIAAMLGMRSASIRVLLHRARKRAAAALGGAP
jgi:RNA polymerase sigma-70 factor (ECF subfamily)